MISLVSHSTLSTAQYFNTFFEPCLLLTSASTAQLTNLILFFSFQASVSRSLNSWIKATQTSTMSSTSTRKYLPYTFTTIVVDWLSFRSTIRTFIISRPILLSSILTAFLSVSSEFDAHPANNIPDRGLLPHQPLHPQAELMQPTAADGQNPGEPQRLDEDHPSADRRQGQAQQMIGLQDLNLPFGSGLLGPGL